MKQGSERRLEALEQRQQPASPRGRIVIYDPETGQPVPGFEPDATPGVRIWIPSNGREYYDDEA